MEELMELSEDVLLAGVERGLITAKCSGCKGHLTPEQHEDNACPDCGEFVADGDPGHPHVIYIAPN